MVKLKIVNSDTVNERLASAAETQTIRVDGTTVDVVYSCAAIGKTCWTRNVAQFGRELCGWVSPQTAETDNRFFGDVDEAIAWLTAGTQPGRGKFDDEVDYRAAVGDREGNYRMAEMVASGEFDPSEFAACMVLYSHGGLDWGWYSERYSRENRDEWWDENVAEHLAVWPNVPATQISEARVIFDGMRDVLDRQFAAKSAAA